MVKNVTKLLWSIESYGTRKPVEEELIIRINGQKQYGVFTATDHSTFWTLRNS